MSRLIKEKDGPRELVKAQQPLNEAEAIRHLKACQGLAADLAEKSFRQYLQTLDTTFTEQIGQAKSNQEASELAVAMRLFRKNADDLTRYFCGYLSEGFVKFKKQELDTRFADGEANTDSLSILDEAQLEETIAISSMSQKADAEYAEPLWALNQRLALLNGGEQVTEASNPAAPIQLCDALRKALKLLKIDDDVQATAYDVYGQQLDHLVAGVSGQINTYLKEQNVLPNLRYTVPKNSQANATGSATSMQSCDTAQPGEAEAQAYGQAALNPNAKTYQRDLFHAICELQNSVAAASTPKSVSSQAVQSAPPSDAASKANGVLVSSQQLVGALESLQSAAPAEQSIVFDGQKIVPVDISVLSKRLSEQIKNELREEQQQREMSQQGDASDVDTDGKSKETPFAAKAMQTIDLVGLVFEYMLGDENLPDRVKALLSYLHTPFLKVAFIDPDFFEQTEHPARLLLNNLAEAGCRWVGNDNTSQYNIFEKIKETVDRVLKEFSSDLKVITSLLLEFSAYTKNIQRRQELVEKRATEKAQGEERLREVKLKVNDEVQARIVERELPSAILLFLLQPWSDYLSFALLRFGEKSEKWRKALEVIDDVLWCIEPKDNDPERKRQVQMHDDIITLVEHGFDTIGFDQDKGRKLIEALSSLIKLAVQSKKAEPAPAPMRERLQRIAAEKAGADDLLGENATPELRKIIASLKIIEFGTWFEFKGGKRLKVAWYNGRTSHYMFVDQMGKRVNMVSGPTLAEKIIAGDAKVISGSSKPFFERALESIYQNMNEKSQVSPPAEGGVE